MLQTEEHASSYLRNRGFSARVIAAAGWRVEALGAERCRRYGLPPEAADSPVWVIPYRHANGHSKFERIRFTLDEDVERFNKYRQPAGRVLELYDPFGAVGDEPLDAVMLIEGEANAVAAHQAQPGFPVLGLPGQAAMKEEMARELGHVQTVFLWVDRHDRGAEANARRIATLLRRAGVEEVRQVRDTAGMDANEALQAFGSERFGSELTTMRDRAEVVASIMDAREDWPVIVGRRLPPFPVDALPDKAARFVEAVAHETQTPVDLAALDALGVLAAAAQGAAIVDCGAWTEELSLYLLVAMPSGEHKSAVLRSVLAPFRQIERELIDEASEKVRDQRLRLEQLQASKARLLKKIGGDDEEARLDAEGELARVVEEVEAIGEPRMPRLLADDATPEALASLLANHGSIAIMAAEAPIIDNIIGRYDGKGSANLTLFCRGYTGEEMRVDRRGRDPELIERPLITTLLTVQDHVLKQFIEHPTARNQGLVGRFAYATPESRLGSRVISGIQPVSDELAGDWERIVRHVYLCRQLTEPTNHSAKGVSVGSVGCQQERVLKISLSPSALALLNDLRSTREPDLSAGGDLRDVSDWIAREAGRAARLAALLHLAENDPRAPIGESVMRRALQITAYLTEHSLAALTAPDERARRALKVLGRRTETTISVRELHRDVLNARGKAADAERLAEALVELGALRPRAQPVVGSGRPPSPAFDINPRLRDA